MGSQVRASKNAKGGLKAVNENPKEIFGWDQAEMVKLLNVYEKLLK